MPETLEDLQDFFRRAVKADFENGTLLEDKKTPISFYPHEGKRRLSNWFCEKVFDLLLPSDRSLQDRRKELVRNYCKKICPNLADIFIILFAYTRPKDLETALHLFRQNILDQDSDISDKDLPLTELLARQFFGEKAGKAFFKYQRKFLANTLQEGEFRQRFPLSTILPWYDEQDSFLGRGAYGSVFKVKIVRGHFTFKEPRSSNADPVLLARKDFGSDGYADFQAEDAILQQLMTSTTCPSSIMRPICSVIYTPQTEGCPSSSIFFLPAKQNLWEFFMTKDAMPKSDADRLQNIQRMLGICQGLDWLHRNLEYQPIANRPQVTAYYHCDLKPDNILICEDPSTRSLVFRISDFGQARGLRQKTSAGEQREAGSKVPLPNDQGEYTYLPPECQTRKSQASANSRTDVWSFGCILLLMMVFNHEGKGGIEGFQTQRINESLISGQRSDRFYVEDTNPRLNPAVTRYLRDLGNRSRSDTDLKVNGDADSTFTQSTAKYLERSVLVVRPGKRDRIETVLKTLQKSYNDRPPAHSYPIPRANVPPDATYCSNLPDGKLLFFSKGGIRVYEPSAASSTGVLINPLGGYEAWSDLVQLRPSYKSCTTSAICTVLTPPDVSRPTFAHVHGLGTEPHSNIVLSAGRIHVESVALSQNGSLVALCSTSLRHEGSPVRVSLYHLVDLERAAPRASENTAPVTENDLSRCDILMNRTLGDSGCIERFERVVGLCFSADGQILYCVYKMPDTEKQVKACLWSTNHGTKVTERIIRDEESGANYRGFFLASIVPLNTATGFVYITNEDSIGFQTLHNNILHEDFAKVPGCAALKAVLLSSDDQRLVMISQKNDGLHIYGCWRHKLQVHKPDELTIDGTIRGLWYDPLMDSAFLMDSAGKLQLHLTICQSKTTHVIGLDSLFVSDIHDADDRLSTALARMGTG